MRLTLVADNSTSPNWGCRATSFALREVLSTRHEIVGSIDRDLLKAPLTVGGRLPVGLHEQLVRRLRRPRVGRVPVLGRLAFGAIDAGGQYFPPSHDIEADAEMLWDLRENSAKAQRLIAEIAPCDAIVVNGEGEMIFSTPARDSLLQTLAICALARRMGKGIFWINGMISLDPASPFNVETRDAAQQALRGAKIATRDDRSLALAQDILPGMVSASFPDALFTWSPFYRRNAALAYDASRLIPAFDRTATSRPKCTDDAYIALSGSSQSAKNQKKATESYTQLAQALTSLGLPVLLVETCVGDVFLRDVARKTGLPRLGVNAPIMAGAAVMANARAFVSGRWHPGIMAALGGTPSVFMSSNSHKTAALQDMLGYPAAHEYSAFPSATDIDRIVADTKMLLAQGADRRRQIAETAAERAEEAWDMLQVLD